MLGSIGSIISAGSSILGALGQGKNKGAQAVSGYASNPSEIKDYMLDVLFPQMQDYQKQGYKGLPLRRINAEDQDPVFGSKARVDIQNYKDMMAAMKATKPAEEGQDEAAMAEAEAASIGRDWLNQAGGTMQQPKSSNTAPFRAKQYMDSGILDNKGLAAIGRYAQAPNDQKKIDDYLKTINVDALIEAYKQKGMM